MKKFILAIIALTMAAITAGPAAAQTFTVLHQFKRTDGSLPEAALVQDSTGNLYGTTFAGGDASEGTVFKLSKTGVETILITFNTFNGSFPASSLVFDKAGNLYGTAMEGSGGAGVLFRVNKTGGNPVTLHAFQGGQDSVAAVPQGGLIVDSLGNLYGATALGGAGFGVLYEVDPAGDLRVLHTFDGKDGADPQGPLVRDAAGNIFGVALAGGTHNRGTVFQLGIDGTLTVLHNFGGKDGISPQGGLFRDSAGNLFGSALGGGDSAKGTIFEITKAGGFRRLYSFTGGLDGANPNGGLIRDAAGNIFGTAQMGGVQGLGTVFQLSPAHVLTVLHAFEGTEDGAFPLAGLLRDSGGNLFGTAVKNFLPLLQDGTVFKITPQ